MSPRTLVLGPVVALGLVALVALVACPKSSEHEASEAAKATAVASEKQERAVREVERGDPERASRALEESAEANERAARESEDVAEAVDRERARFRVLLTKEIAWVDRRVADLERSAKLTQGSVRAEREHDVGAVREWRARLQHDLEAIDAPPTGLEWTALKNRIERDLDEDRPLSIPRSYEKSYGI